MKVIKRINTCLVHKGFLPVIHAVQYDTGLRIIISIKDFSIPEGTTAKAFFKKPSGKFVYQDASISGNDITIDVENQALTEYGYVYYQVRLINGNDIITTYTGKIDAEKSLADSSATSSETIVPAFDSAVQKAVTEIESARDSAIQYIGNGLDSSLTQSGKAADAEATGAAIDELKSDLAKVKEHTRNLWENGDVEGTKYAFIPCELQAGTYTISTIITSSDVNKQESKIEFCSGDVSTIIGSVTLDRNTRVNGTFTLTEPCTHLLFWASTNSSYSTGDTFKYADIQIEQGEHVSKYIIPFTTCDSIAREKFESESVIGKRFEYKSNSIVGTSSYLISTEYIPCVKKNERIVFNANVNSIGSVIFGFLRSSFDNMTNRIVIDGTNITVYSYNGTQTEYTHGLSISNNVTMLIESNSTNEATLTLISNGEIFKQEIRWDRRYNCKLFVRGGSGTNISNVTMSWTCTDIVRDIWIFGDSYLSYTDRWYKYLFQYGYHNNVMMNAYPGENSDGAFVDLISLLKLHTPKCIVWCLGMNDGSDTDTPSTTWVDNINKVIKICEKLDIELLMATIPTVPTISNEQKNSVVRTSGYRYIDFANAVGASSSGVWFDNMLSSDGIHPTDKGAKALFGQVISDVPELMITN